MALGARGRARCAALAALLALAAAGAAATGVAAGLGPLPLLGAADAGMTLMGAAPGGRAGRGLGLPAAAAGRRRASAAATGQLALRRRRRTRQPEPQLAFLRYTDATGWQVFETPVDEHGNPYRGPVPNRLSARITPRGGGVLVGRDPSRPVGDQVVVLAPRPGRPLARRSPRRRADVLLAGRRRTPAEALADDQGARRASRVAAFDEGGRPASSSRPIGPRGRRRGAPLRRRDGPASRSRSRPARRRASTSSRSPPPGSATPGRSPRPTPRSAARVVLLERTLDAGRPALGRARARRTPFAARDTPGEGIAGAAPLGGAAQPLTVTAATASGSTSTATIAGIARDVTLFYDAGAGAVTGSWCDADRLRRRARRSRSRARAATAASPGPAPGSAPGSITNPLDPGGGEDSNRGTYLRLRPTARFARMPGGGGNFRPSGAFASADERLARGTGRRSRRSTAPARLRSWPVALRAPLTDVATAPGAPPGALGAGALAVGADGARRALRSPAAAGGASSCSRSSGSVNKRDAARRRLARARRAPTPSATSARCGCGAPTTDLWSATRASRSASRAT